MPDSTQYFFIHFIIKKIIKLNFYRDNGIKHIKKRYFKHSFPIVF